MCKTAVALRRRELWLVMCLLRHNDCRGGIGTATGYCCWLGLELLLLVGGPRLLIII